MANHGVRTLAILLLAVAGTRAGDDAPMRKARLETIQKEYVQKQDDYRKAAAAAATEADSRSAEKLRPSVREFAEKSLALAKESPADDVARDALVWIVANDARRGNKNLDEALELIEKHHLGSPKLASVVDSLAYSDSARAKALLAALIEKGGDRNLRGQACLFLAYGEYERSDPDGKVKPLMRRIKKEFADVPFGSKTLGKLADDMLFELEHLVPGKVAPDIEGVDVADKKMKLSDHRGKVVLLVFWGSWCGPCMADVPDHQKRLDKYACRPFAVVGVNGGDEKVKAANAIKARKMGWPNFFDGEDGPIVGRWNVMAFPTVYVIDAKGVIRYHGDDGIEEAIEAALDDAEKERQKNAMIEWGPKKSGVRCAAALASEGKVYAGEPVHLRFLTANVDAKAATVVIEGHPLAVYKMTVLGPDGKPATLTAYGQQQTDISGDGSRGTGELAAGKEDHGGMLLSRIYDMTRMGDYTVSFTRWVKVDGADVLVTSNVLKIEVLGERAEYMPN